MITFPSHHKGTMCQTVMTILQYEMEKDGINLHPKKIKTQIMTQAQTLEIPVSDLAKVVKLVFTRAFKDTMLEVETLINEEEGDWNV